MSPRGQGAERAHGKDPSWWGSLALAVLVLRLLPGCSSPDLEAQRWTCMEDRDCPAGQSCYPGEQPAVPGGEIFCADSRNCVPGYCRSATARVAGGLVRLGCPESCDENERYESPPRTVAVGAFEIDVVEVRLTEYVARMGSPPSCDDTGWYPEWPIVDAPVVCATHAQAKAYCEHAQTGARLCSEDEWELAARGPDQRIYPWGDEAPGKDHANCGVAEQQASDDPECRDAFETGAPVGSFPHGEAPSGALDLAGNVAEWTADSISNGDGPEMVIRGGAYPFPPVYMRTFTRSHIAAATHEEWLGFRCCRAAR